MVYLIVLIGVVLVAILMSPFAFGPGGLLAAGSSVHSAETLMSLKDVIIQRYLEDERAFKDGSLGKLAWERRRSFLINRFIDAARRLDYLENQSHQAPQSVAKKGAGDAV